MEDLFKTLGSAIRPEKTKLEISEDLPMDYVYLSSPENSQMFTRCCNVAICSDQQRCPRCHRYIYGHDAVDAAERAGVRWRFAFHK